MKATSFFILALVLIAGYIAGARWPQAYLQVANKIAGQ